MPEQPTREDEPIEVTPVEARQGGGPIAMVTVLTVSLLLAGVMGLALWALFA